MFGYALPPRGKFFMVFTPLRGEKTISIYYIITYISPNVKQRKSPSFRSGKFKRKT